jgi:hypothetical protein
MSMLRSAPGWPMDLAAVIATIGLIAGCSAPGGYFPYNLLFTLLWLVLGGVWLARVLVWVLLNRTSPPISPMKVHNWRRWAVVPFLAILTLLAPVFSFPVRVRFAISRNQLNRLAQQAAASGPRALNRFTAPTQRAGAYWVSVDAVKPDGEVDFWVTGTEFFRSFGGFVYSPSGEPSDPEGSFEPLGGNWYEWHTSW